MDPDKLLDLAETFRTWDRLKSQDKELFESSSYEGVQHDLNAIQSQRQITKTMMNMKRMHRFLTGMAHLEKVLAAVRFPHSAKVMAYVWGPVRFLLNTTNLNDRAFDGVLDIYEQLGNKIPPLYEYMRLFTGLPESERCLVYIYRDVLTFHRLAYKLFSLPSNLWQKLYRPTWKALSHTFEQLASSLERHLQFIQMHGSSLRNSQPNLDQGDGLARAESGLDTPQDWGDAKMEFYRYRNDMNGSRDQFEEKEKARREEEKRSVMAWISASKNTQSLHKKFQDARICPDTGRWLFRRYSEVTDWMKEDQPPESALWLYGSKGFGKTVLASLLIDELKELCTEKKKYTIPRESKTYYFYCQEEDPEHRTYPDILKGILHQMIDADEDLLPLCVEKAASSGSTNLDSNPEIAESLIEAFLEYNSRQYIIIDGLDECETLEEMRQTAVFFMRQVTKCDNEIKQGRLRVLFMSQLIPELAEDKIMPEDGACVELKSTDNADDIRSYVKKRIPDFSKKRATRGGFNLSDSDKGQIESIICRRSEDMFLYAHLAIEYLLQQPTKEMLLEKIKEEMLPEKLAQIYEKLLGAVKAELLQLADGETHWQMAKLLLGWLVCAKRPLKWHEMQSILSYDPVNQRVDFDNKMLRQNAKKYLGSLVHVLDGDHIRIIHSTARRYIVQNEHINEQAVQCELTVLCLKYLCLLSLSNGYDEPQRQNKAKLGWFSFQDYACSQWHSHVATVMMACRDLFFYGHHSQEYEEKFGAALRDFIETHRGELTTEPHPDLGQIPAELARFSRLSFYENLRLLWNHIYTHQKGTYDARNTVGIAQLDKTLLENRCTLEEHFKPSSKAWLDDTIEDYYGPNLFKCKRVLCKFFYQGFDRKNDRETHDRRHDRPFLCPVNCSLAPIGFASNKDKERHVRTYHPDLGEGPSVFEALRSRTGSPRFTCNMCGKKFTRKITLKGHERSHFGERPYACPICDKSFTRLNDCRRHEKIHSRRRA
ncbi:Zinc finger protein (Fragment) [Madurella fahalii]|uniref:Zinc finger protein n=1 Tax=Madurella fahalii TaxID=1157608 RepID=A0ABQ0G9V6_9PEZI